jgi:hypothetical protein
MLSIFISEIPSSWSPPSVLPSYTSHTPGAPTQSAARFLSKAASSLGPGEAYSSTPVLPEGTHTITHTSTKVFQLFTPYLNYP